MFPMRKRVKSSKPTAGTCSGSREPRDRRAIMIDPNDSDWSELDLLTRNEVHLRLRAEVAEVGAQLAELKLSGSDHDAAAIAALSRRLNALLARLAQ